MLGQLSHYNNKHARDIHILIGLSVVMGMGEINLMLAKIWFGLRIAYLVGAAVDLYSIPMVRPLIWLPSIVVLVMMGLNLCVS